MGTEGLAGRCLLACLAVSWCRCQAAQPRAVPSAQSKSLDEALALWKQLLASEGVPAVHSPEQTVASLLITASLYRLMAKVVLLGLPRGAAASPQHHPLTHPWVFLTPSLCKPWRATC